MSGGLSLHIATEDPIRRGNNITLITRIWDSEREGQPVPIDPNGFVKVTLTDPDGHVIVDAVAMTRVSVGYYRYRWQSTQDTPVGTYTMESMIQDDGRDFISDRFEFTVIS
jgi:uncharacterized protein YfaS (alpha-2-macroglobulin family)